MRIKAWLSSDREFRLHFRLTLVSRKISLTHGSVHHDLALTRTFKSLWRCKFYTVGPWPYRLHEDGQLSSPLQRCNIDVFTVSPVHHWQLHFSQREMKRRKSVMDDRDYCLNGKNGRVSLFANHYLKLPRVIVAEKYLRNYSTYTRRL